MCVWRERDSVCVRGRERVCVCGCVRGRERECVFMCECVLIKLMCV